jgi:DNA-binding NarL/FixJ family response regulator
VKRPDVLLADDNKYLLERLVEILSPSFNVVGIAHDGQELVSSALRLVPDVIILDIGMPILTGIQAARQLREAGLSTKFVFLTIHREEEFLEACLDVGALGFVLKSQMKNDLIAAIHSALADKLFVSPALSTKINHPRTQ